MTPAVVQNEKITNLGDDKRRSRRARAANTGVPHAVPTVLAIVVGLSLTACPVAPELEKPYEEYEPIPSGASSTTSGSDGCNDSTVNEPPGGSPKGMLYWCGSKTCHGDPGETSNASAPLWLFSSTRATDLLDLPGTEEGCTTELVINTTTPAASLILTTMNKTTPVECGLEMPKGLDAPPEEYACIEQWVYSLIEAAN